MPPSTAEPSAFGGIIAVNPEGGKEARAAAVQPQIESGNVYLPDGADWLEAFIDEFAAFPRGRHDDQVDALSQALLDLGVNPPSSLELWGKINYDTFEAFCWAMRGIR